MYSITEAGEAYLKYWADSLNQYQKMMDTFFRLYTGRSKREDKKE
jgi:PadR family transcriptional regulator, regulatory protein PadR